MVFEFDGLSFISDNFFFESTEESQSELWLNLRVGALRLGKTCLYISCSQTTRKVFLSSVDNKYVGKSEESPSILAYIEDLRSGTILSQSGRLSKQNIIGILSTQVTDPLSLLSQGKDHL